MRQSLMPAAISPWILLPEPQDDASRQQTEERHHVFSREIGLWAVRSLYDELMLYPKPCLMSPIDNSSQDDMDAGTFMRSLFALRHYFVRIARAGINDAPFAELKRLGMQAEEAMLAATGGINTHGGAIFSLGMLCASIGCCRARGIAISPESIRAILLIQWGQALAAHSQCLEADSHSLQVAATYAVSSVKKEVALGMPSVFEVALPALNSALAAGRSWKYALIDALFSLMAHISDTNVYHRTGQTVADTVKALSGEFFAAGDTACTNWRERALQCHRIFVGMKVSPGGAADLLAATCLVHKAVSRLRRI